MIQGLQDRLFESVRLRLKADVPVGVYLSGGIGKINPLYERKLF